MGVVIHQFDGMENREMPWEACAGSQCVCQGMTVPGRLSVLVASAALRLRPDREVIPMPFADRAGILIRAETIEFECGYGIDAHTYVLADAAKPGCAHDWCVPGDLLDRNGQLCGFHGAPPGAAWRAEDLEQMLKLHLKHGSAGRMPGFHSGYNEMIISSEKFNARLPQSVQAFFVLEERYARGDSLGYDVSRVHADFLATFGLSSSDVPLLKLAVDNWEQPFALLEASSNGMHE
jgi:hypothetical protein